VILRGVRLPDSRHDIAGSGYQNFPHLFACQPSQRFHHRYPTNPTKTPLNTTTPQITIIMFRSAIVRATRAAARPAVFRPAVVPKAVFPSAIRYYSAPASLSKDEVEGRIKDLLKGFDKV
jgi:hypothetical protein